MNKNYKDIFKENQKHNEELFKSGGFGEEISKNYKSFEELYTDTLAAHLVSSFKTRYGDDWALEYSKYMQQNERRLEYMFNPSLKKYNSFEELDKDIKSTCEKEFASQNNKDVLKNLEKLMNKNPQFAKAMGIVCDACMKNPACMMSVTSVIGKFSLQVAKAYLVMGIREAERANSR